LRGGNFLPDCFRAEDAVRVGSGSSLRQQGSKARKNLFLIEKILRASSKNVSIFAGFVRH
jgi:hypothetical protein